MFGDTPTDGQGRQFKALASFLSFDSSSLDEKTCAWGYSEALER